MTSHSLPSHNPSPPSRSTKPTGSLPFSKSQPPRKPPRSTREAHCRKPLPESQPLKVAPLLLKRNGSLNPRKSKPKPLPKPLSAPSSDCFPPSCLRYSKVIDGAGESFSTERDETDLQRYKRTVSYGQVALGTAELPMNRRQDWDAGSGNDDSGLADDEYSSPHSTAAGNSSGEMSIIAVGDAEDGDAAMQGDGVGGVREDVDRSSSLAPPSSESSMQSSTSTEVSLDFNVDGLDGLWPGFWESRALDNRLIGDGGRVADMREDQVRSAACRLLEAMLQHSEPADESHTWRVEAQSAFYDSGATGNSRLRPDVLAFALPEPMTPDHERHVALLVEVKAFGRGIQAICSEADKQIRARAEKAAESANLDRLIMISLIGHSIRIYYWQRRETPQDHKLGTIRPSNSPGYLLEWRDAPPPIPASRWLPLSSNVTRRILQRVIMDCRRAAIGQDTSRALRIARSRAMSMAHRDRN